MVGCTVAKGDRYVVKDSQGDRTPEVLDTRDEPERVRVFRQPVAVRGRVLDLSFDPLSVTLYELRLREPVPLDNPR